MSQALAVLHRDAALVAFDKPSGLLTVPGRDARAPSLWRLGEASEGRLWPVHRLDRETSGVVLFARNAAAHRALNQAFENREVQKLYRAQVSPPPHPASAVLTDTLVPARRGFMRLAREGEAGVIAETVYRTLDTAGDRALLELAPVTGRTHQLRLQLATCGSPIVGESHYRSLRDGRSAVPAPRLWLHALAVSFRHPSSCQETRIEAPLPVGLWPPG